MAMVRLKNTKKYCVPTILKKAGSTHTVKIDSFETIEVDSKDFTANTMGQIQNGILRVLNCSKEKDGE